MSWVGSGRDDSGAEAEYGNKFSKTVLEEAEEKQSRPSQAHVKVGSRGQKRVVVVVGGGRRTDLRTTARQRREQTVHPVVLGPAISAASDARIGSRSCCEIHFQGKCTKTACAESLLLLAVLTCIIVERKESRVAGGGIKEQQTPFC